MSALDDRRQNAREAYYDRVYLTRDLSAAFDEAIETAARVKITYEIVQAYMTADNIDDGLIAAFRAAGFEVIE